MSRLADRGAVVAAYVGIGMAVVIGVSFLLIIPIEPIFWLLAIPAGLLIGYYANQRSDRRAGPFPRIVLNGAFAGVVTGLTFVILLLAVKALFFYADGGYPDFNRVDPETRVRVAPFCDPGAGCVYARYLAGGSAAGLADAGITNVEDFTALYWSQQFSTAATLLVITTAGALGGAVVYQLSRPRSRRPAGSPEGRPVG